MEFVDFRLSDNEFQKIRSLVNKFAGINIEENKRALVISRLYRRLQQLKLSSFGSYLHRLESNPNEIHLMINQITTNFTQFFREEKQFVILQNKILPEILKKKKKNNAKTFRIWSAGCSTGEEVYSILIYVLNTFRHLKKNGINLSSFDLKILGSDIDTQVLNKAFSGRFSKEETKSIRNDILEEFFFRSSNGYFQIKQEFKKFVLFERINLVHDPFQFKNKIDIIFCRNVLIYFNHQNRLKVYKKFYSVLNLYGYLFSGHSENLFKYQHLFKFLEQSIYQRVNS